MSITPEEPHPNDFDTACRSQHNRRVPSFGRKVEEMALEGPWMIQVPFVSAPELCFTEELAKTVAGSTVFIRPGTAPYSRLVVEELATIDQARDQFLTLKRAMLAASLNVGCGIYIKNNLIVFDDDRAQLPSEPDQPFVCRQERNLAHLIITVGEPQFQLPHALPKLIESIEIAMTSKFAVEAICDQSVVLACDLYTSSFYEKTFASRLISLIGVLEVLKDQDWVSPEAQTSGTLGEDHN